MFHNQLCSFLFCIVNFVNNVSQRRFFRHLSSAAEVLFNALLTPCVRSLIVKINWNTFTKKFWICKILRMFWLTLKTKFANEWPRDLFVEFVEQYQKSLDRPWSILRGHIFWTYYFLTKFLICFNKKVM